MAADDKKSKYFREPSSLLWTATSMVIIYAVWCLLLLILTASGHLLNSQSFECVNSKEDATRLRKEAVLVYVWSGCSMVMCIVLLWEFWRKDEVRRPLQMLFGATTVLFVIMVAYFVGLWEGETLELQEFEKRYLALLPLTNTQNQSIGTVCNNTLSNVNRWQAEFKCCGLQGYQDWESPIPDSCLCDIEDNSSGCVGVGDSLVYEKPCLPTVLSLVEKRSSTFWIVMIVWLTIVGAIPVPVIFFILLVCFFCLAIEGGPELSHWVYRMRGGEKMVPVVFIRKNNNNETQEDNMDSGGEKKGVEVDGIVLDIEEGTNVQGEGRETEEGNLRRNAVHIIPLSELRRLQEQLDPPPVQHTVRCFCLNLVIPCKPKDLYTVLIEEGSPLLPSDAVLVDAEKPANMYCTYYVEHHIFSADHIVWPRGRETSYNL